MDKSFARKIAICNIYVFHQAWAMPESGCMADPITKHRLILPIISLLFGANVGSLPEIR